MFMTNKIKRFFRRLKNCFDFKDINNWEYESCENCGSCFRIAYDIKGNIWNEVYDSGDGCLCLNCFLKKASEKNIFLTNKDFNWLCLFTMDKNKSYNIIGE